VSLGLAVRAMTSRDRSGPDRIGHLGPGDDVKVE
jgi:hypothetical protein